MPRRSLASMSVNSHPYQSYPFIYSHYLLPHTSYKRNRIVVDSHHSSVTIILINMRFFLILCAIAVAVATPVEKESRIVGGNTAARGQFPHQVSVRDFDNEHLCGGWIHTSRWIVSSGRVLFGRTIADTQVVVGTNLLSEGGYEYQLSRIIVHPNFNDYNLDNNLALLEILFEIDFYPTVQPIPLATFEITGTTTAVVAGWGQVNETSSLSDSLQWIYVDTLVREKYEKSHWGSDPSNVFLSPLHRPMMSAENGTLSSTGTS